MEDKKFIGEREIKSFSANENGDWIKVEFENGEHAEMSGTLFFNVQTDKPLPGATTSQLVASYFATNLLKELAVNRIELGMLSHVQAAINNLIEVKKEKAFAHPFGKKYFLQVTFDQMLATAQEAEDEEEAERAAAKETKPVENVSEGEASHS